MEPRLIALLTGMPEIEVDETKLNAELAKLPEYPDENLN